MTPPPRLIRVSNEIDSHEFDTARSSVWRRGGRYGDVYVGMYVCIHIHARLWDDIIMMTAVHTVCTYVLDLLDRIGFGVRLMVGWTRVRVSKSKGSHQEGGWEDGGG